MKASQVPAAPTSGAANESKPGAHDSFATPHEGAVSWCQFGYAIVPLADVGSPQLRERWRDGVTLHEVNAYWSRRNDHEVGAFLGDSLVVLEADGPGSLHALKRLENAHDARTELVIRTQRGEQHFFRLAEDVRIPSLNESKATHRYHIGIKTGDDEIVALPPSDGSFILYRGADSVQELTEASQPFLDAINTHNQHLPKTRLDRHSLRGKADELERAAVEQVAILGRLVLLGQLTGIFAAPNTGKTLILLALLIEAIGRRLIDPASVYYVNVDDTGKGLAEKARFADEYGFHLLADGLQEFDCGRFLDTLEAMIAEGQAHGVVVILDTLKKFVDLMDKRQASTFTKIVRRFAAHGGTLIALAHVNKNLRNGKPVYAGTSDVVDDFDCAYTVAPLPDAGDADTKVVVFENLKRRGHVALQAAYSYSAEPSIGYAELVASVTEVKDEEFRPLKEAAERVPDLTVLRAAEALIREGINTKMLLADAVNKRTGVSKRTAIQVIERYTGSDPGKHRWMYAVHARGAKVFTLLSSAPPLPNEKDQSG